MLLKIEYLFPAELLVESQGIVFVNIIFLKQLSRLMFKNLFNYKQASTEKSYGLTKIFSEEKNRDLYA